MTYLEDKIWRFERMIGDFYYKGCLGYNEIYIIALMYFQNNIECKEISYEDIKKIVFKEINSLIDLD